MATLDATLEPHARSAPARRQWRLGPVDAPGGPRRLRLESTITAGLALAWVAVCFGPRLGTFRMLDGFSDYRETVWFHEGGFRNILQSGDGSMHPPLTDLLGGAAFALLGVHPGSLAVVGAALLVLVGVGTQRALAHVLPRWDSIAGALAVMTTPMLAFNLVSHLSRDALMVALLAAAIAIFRVRQPSPQRRLALGLVLAGLPLAKETGVLLVIPFLLVTLCDRLPTRGLGARMLRVSPVLAPPLAALLIWRQALVWLDGGTWASYSFNEQGVPVQTVDSPYLTALRGATVNLGDRWLGENLINGMVVNFLWVPTLIAALGLVGGLARRRWVDGRLTALLVAIVIIYAWGGLTFPTWTIPRYTLPLVFAVGLLAILAVASWSPYPRRVAIAVLLTCAAVGLYSSSDPVTQRLVGTAYVSGEKVYGLFTATRGPDGVVINNQVLRASARLQGYLEVANDRKLDALVGDCAALKLDQLLVHIEQARAAYPMFPGTHPLICVGNDPPALAGLGPGARVALLPQADGTPATLTPYAPDVTVLPLR